MFLRKLVTLMMGENEDLKVAACFTIKNLLFKNNKDIRSAVMSEISNEQLNLLLEDQNIRVQE